MAREERKSTESQAPAKPKKKWLLIVVGAVVAAMAIGGGAWYFSKVKKPAGQEVKPTENSTQPIFVPLDSFTVNLQREQGDQVLQVGLTLKIYNQDLNEKIKNAMPEIRSNLLLLLSSKRASELISVEGKKKLVGEIITLVNGILGIAAPRAQPAAVAPAEIDTTASAGAPTPAAPASAPGQEGTVPQSATTAPTTAATTAPTPAPSPPEANSRAGVTDVLFTAFIIQ